MAKINASLLTKKELTDNGYDVDRCDEFVKFGGDRKGGFWRDLFNFADLVAVADDETLYVQATSKSNMSARIKKIYANRVTQRIANVDPQKIRIYVVGWKKEVVERQEICTSEWVLMDPDKFQPEEENEDESSGNRTNTDDGGSTGGNDPALAGSQRECPF